MRRASIPSRTEGEIDYVIGNKEVKEKVKDMRIGDKVDSDHHSMEVGIEGKGG